MQYSIEKNQAAADAISVAVVIDDWKVGYTGL